MLKFMPPSRVPPRSAVSLAEQHQAIAKLIIEADLSLKACHRISHHAAQMVRRIHADAKPFFLRFFLPNTVCPTLRILPLCALQRLYWWFRMPLQSMRWWQIKLPPGTRQGIAVMPPQRW